MNGLPLALDQAGAYIASETDPREKPSSSLVHYLDYYMQHRIAALQERGQSLPNNHPDPVTVTWQVSFHKVELANEVAAQVTRYS